MKNEEKTNRPTLTVVGDAPRHDEELRLWLENHLRKHPHLTLEKLSRHTHIGKGAQPSTLRAYLDCKYFAPKEEGGLGVQNSKLEDRIRAYKDRVEGSPRDNNQIPFIETGAWQQFQHACYTAIKENAIVVVYGKPGLGKSRYLREYGYQKQDAVPIQILCSANITPKFFAEEIARELKIDDRYSLPKLEKAISEKLQKYPRPLFVDQANYLNEKALGTICHLWETAHIPVVLIGTQDLHTLFVTSQLTEDVRAQLSSRVSMHYPLMDLTKTESVQIIRHILGDDATDARIAQIMRLTQGNFRHLSFIFPRIEDVRRRFAKQLESGDVEMEDVIETAGQRLMVG